MNIHYYIEEAFGLKMDPLLVGKDFVNKINNRLIAIIDQKQYSIGSKEGKMLENACELLTSKILKKKKYEGMKHLEYALSNPNKKENHKAALKTQAAVNYHVLKLCKDKIKHNDKIDYEVKKKTLKEIDSAMRVLNREYSISGGYSKQRSETEKEIYKPEKKKQKQKENLSGSKPIGIMGTGTFSEYSSKYLAIANIIIGIILGALAIYIAKNSFNETINVHGIKSFKGILGLLAKIGSTVVIGFLSYLAFKAGIQQLQGEDE